MIKCLNHVLKTITVALEFVISFILAAAICVMLVQLVGGFASLPDLHSNPVHSLIGVISIAILFATRKFLFVAFDESIGHRSGSL
jgi:hypothetical protein